ncbi:TIGR04190 family B12-binding domain/radical SAM domain protein [Planctomycetota bacterium]
MSAPDLILLHAPSVYDFRQRPILFGPVSDVVPSTQIFEMYPIGFLTMLEHLQQNGMKVRIINVALQMLRRRRFNVEKLIKGLKPRAFGIDLHWMVHAQGSLELARMVKKHHPDIPVIFGGLSASFFHEELIRKPEVDYIVRGDSAEEPLRLLMEGLAGEGSLADVPNLCWKDQGEVRINKLEHVPDDLNGVSFDYRTVMRATMRTVLRHLDFWGHLPFKQWLQYPILAALTCRGCVHNCVICGGSASAFKTICGRARPAYRDLETIAKDIALISRYIKAPVIVLGDMLQGGMDRADAFLKALKKAAIKNHLAFEFFAPPPEGFIQRVADAVPNFNIQISPESHDETVRRAFGRPYDNASLERFISEALDAGCARLDVFFMIGLPQQTAASVRATSGYARELVDRFGSGANQGRLLPFISPLAPFLDPGSPAFLEPAKHGYKLFCRTLDEHVRALEEPSWKRTLNYETKWMSRDEIAAGTYEAALELNRIKQDYGLIREKDAGRIDVRIRRELEILQEIDRACLETDPAEREKQLQKAVSDYDCFHEATICRKTEMNWPTRLLRFNPVRIMAYLLRKGFSR